MSDEAEITIEIGGRLDHEDVAKFLKALRRSAHVERQEFVREMQSAREQRRCAQFSYKRVPTGYMNDVREILKNQEVEHLMIFDYGEGIEGWTYGTNEGTHVDCRNVHGDLMIAYDELRRMNAYEISSMMSRLQGLELGSTTPLAELESARDRIAFEAGVADGFES